MAEALRGRAEGSVADVAELREMAALTVPAIAAAKAAADAVAKAEADEANAHDGVGAAVESVAAEDDAPADSLEFDTLMARLQLSAFQAWLVQAGWSSTAAVRRALVTTKPQGLVRFAADFGGNVSELADALVAARDALSQEAEAAAAFGGEQGGVAPDEGAGREGGSAELGRVPLELYLQGLGSTVLVAVLSPSHARNQALLSELSAEVKEGLAALEEGLTSQSHTLGDTESQRTVEEYNFVTFDGETHSVSGWCNTDRFVGFPDNSHPRLSVV